jgi:hypothetical protein
MALNQFTNNAGTTLASGINTSVTSLTVSTGSGALFPTLTGSAYFYCTLQQVSTNAVEIVKVTARSTDTFTIVRAQDGTTALSFVTGDYVQLRLTAADLNNFGQLDSTNTWASAQTFSAAPIITPLTGLLYGNASSALTAATAAQVVSVIGSTAVTNATNATNVTGTVGVANGGTGLTSTTAYGVLAGGTTTTGALQNIGTGTSGQILTSNGPGVLPSFQTAASSGFTNMQVFTSPGTFTTPSSTTKIKVTVVGGGGSGGASPNGGGGGGGGGGAIYVGPVTVSTPYAVTVGSGGATVSGNSIGNTGGTSSFSTLASATGGSSGSGGSGGTAGSTAVLGGLGSAGTLQFGGGVGLSKATTVAPAAITGSGGSSYLGGGGNGVSSSGGTGVAGQNYGGGGSGGPNGTSSGAGAVGVVIVEY